jgi:hypothetical protein
VHLERTNSGHQHSGSGTQARLAALDVEELLTANIGAKTSFRDHKSV